MVSAGSGWAGDENKLENYSLSKHSDLVLERVFFASECFLVNTLDGHNIRLIVDILSHVHLGKGATFRGFR